MRALKRLWDHIARFAEALDGVDDPRGEYMLHLGKRLERVERAVERLERGRDSHPNGSGIPQ
jgi:hypothetical protein